MAGIAHTHLLQGPAVGWVRHRIRVRIARRHGRHWRRWLRRLKWAALAVLALAALWLALEYLINRAG
jgi:hypothetical protein